MGTGVGVALGVSVAGAGAGVDLAFAAGVADVVAVAGLTAVEAGMASCAVGLTVGLRSTAHHHPPPQAESSATIAAIASRIDRLAPRTKRRYERGEDRVDVNLGVRDPIMPNRSTRRSHGSGEPGIRRLDGERSYA